MHALVELHLSEFYLGKGSIFGYKNFEFFVILIGIRSCVCLSVHKSAKSSLQVFVTFILAASCRAARGQVLFTLVSQIGNDPLAFWLILPNGRRFTAHHC